MLVPDMIESRCETAKHWRVPLGLMGFSEFCLDLCPTNQPGRAAIEYNWYYQ